MSSETSWRFRTRSGPVIRIAGHIVTWRGSDVPTVPTSAIFRSGSGWSLFRVVDGRAVESAVDLGRRKDQRAEVRSGVEAGTPLIVFPPETLHDGAPVRPESAEDSGGP